MVFQSTYGVGYGIARLCQSEDDGIVELERMLREALRVRV